MIEIKNRWDSSKIVFRSETANTIMEAVIEGKANLFEANLSEADLSGADLFGSNLSEANLSRANLSGADLFGSNLSGADLFGSNLFEANLLYCKMDKKVFKQITEEWFRWKIIDKESE